SDRQVLKISCLFHEDGRGPFPPKLPILTRQILSKRVPCFRIALRQVQPLAGGVCRQSSGIKRERKRKTSTIRSKRSSPRESFHLTSATICMRYEQAQRRSAIGPTSSTRSPFE